MDNTLVPWRGDEFSPEVLAWIQACKDSGLQLCLVSNTKRPERLQRLSEILGAETVRGKFKPSTQMFVAAMKKFGAEPEETLMVGDQLFTDVLGGNRSGIATIWVRKVSNQEFIGTRLVSRNFEKLVLGKLHSVLQEEDDDLPIVRPEGFFARRTTRQFAKFLIVGGSSFVIDFSIRFILMNYVSVGGRLASLTVGEWMRNTFPIVRDHIAKPQSAAFFVAAAVAGSVAILNSFYWNRRWTFGLHGQEEMAQQMRRFFVLSISVLLLNAFISGVLNNIIPGHPRWSMFLATVIATGIGAVCNFLGQRLWAFRRNS